MSNINDLCKGCELFKGATIKFGVTICCLIKVLPSTVISNCPCSICLLKPICGSRCDARITFFTGLRDEYETELKAEFNRQRKEKNLFRNLY